MQGHGLATGPEPAVPAHLGGNGGVQTWFS